MFATVTDQTMTDQVRAARLRPVTWSRWSAGSHAPPPALAGFITSSFSPMVAHVADLCLSQLGDPASAPTRDHEPTALVIASRSGDVTTAVEVARCVDAGTRVAPLLFYQAVPNAVAGYVAARWGLRGPITCLSPIADTLTDALADALAVARLTIISGDAAEVLIVVAEQSIDQTDTDYALAVLVRDAGTP